MSPFKSLTSIFDNIKIYPKGVIHCGAHIGYEYSEYINMGITNFLFFEPVTKIFKLLEKSVPSKYIIRKAVGNFNGSIKIFVDDHSQGQSSSILRPKLHLLRYPGTTFSSYEDVEIVRLDDFIKEKSLYDFMNVDVQGYEIEVLKGSSELIKQHIKYINTEVNKAELYENCSMIEEIDTFLFSMNFKRILVQWWPGEQWGDAFYVKKEIKC